MEIKLPFCIPSESKSTLLWVVLKKWEFFFIFYKISRSYFTIPVYLDEFGKVVALGLVKPYPGFGTI
jgi:hypothetical protein